MPAKTREQRAQLSAQVIATAALTIADHDGWDALNYRALAKALGCEPMSIYYYFPSKLHLRDALIDLVLADAPVDTDPGKGWRERLWNTAQAYRAASLRHPGMASVELVHRKNHRTGMRWLEDIAAIFAATGLPLETRARSFRVFSYYISGAILDETRGYATGPSAAEPVPADELDAYPDIVAIGRWWSEDQRQSTFDLGLSVLLDWIETEIARLA